jgi:uncharacterized membrane protein
MNWIGLMAGGLVAWLIGSALGVYGLGFAIFGAIVGWALAQQHGVVQSLQERVARLERAAQAAQGASAPAEASMPTPMPMPVQPVTDTTVDSPQAPPPFVDTHPQAERDDVARDATVPPSQVAATPSIAETRRAPAGSTHAALEVDESSPAVTTSLGQSILAWFKGGNTIVRIAVVLLFIGVAFLLRFAAEHALLPLEVRIAAVALGGLALAVVGWRLRESRRGYGLSLQGAGIGIVYLTLFASFRLYQLVPAGLTFAMLALLAAVSAMLAVRQNAMPLALLGFGGGFLAPVLASTGSGSHVALFSYFLVLNVAIAWIARRQTWKPLNLMAFLFTFGIGSLWGAKSYTAADFWTSELFLVLHFVLFLFVSVQYTRQLVAREDAQSREVPTVDGSLLFGVPVAAFGMQAAMLKDQPLALAASAGVLAAVYLLVGRWLWRVSGRRMLLMVEGLLALGVIFLLLVTPLALDAQWTGVAWAVQGAGIVWIGLRQRRWWAAGIGLLMQLAAAYSFWGVSGSAHLMAYRLDEITPFANSSFVSALVLALAALVTALMTYRQRPALATDDGDNKIAQGLHLVHLGMLALGLLQLVGGFWPDLRYAVGRQHEPAAVALMLTGLAALCWAGASRLAWPALQGGARVLLALGVISTVMWSIDLAGSPARTWSHYVSLGNAVVVVATLALGVTLLRRAAPPAWSGELLLLSWAALVHGAVFAHAVASWGVARDEGWSGAAAMALPTAMALWLLRQGHRQTWPVTAPHHASFLSRLHLPWLVVLSVWVLGANLLSDGSMRPLPYLPLLNPTDLMHGLAALYALGVYRAASPTPKRSSWVMVAAALGFVWLNGLLVRSLHHWAGTPMWTNGALDADAVQTGLTILWTACAFITMVMATRRGERKLWTAGAALLAVVVAKLFFVDLSQVGTLARIVSFMGVGGLMLVIGYLSPMPPAHAEDAGKPSGKEAA